ncbi:MAG: hypothetical protein HY023_15990 [Chloroflexi bacterium]|nr:hypothetical protein [Chloroflexota bacterium]
MTDHPPGPPRPLSRSRTDDSAGYIPWWVLLVLVALFGLIFVGAWGFVLATRAALGPRPSPTAVIVLVLPVAGTGLAPTLAPPATPEVTPTIPRGPVGIIQLGDYVKVVGTGGDGLRLRVGPGLQETPNYLALENEVLIVQSGPTIADGFTWWFLVDPADNTRNGWAAENYLEVVKNP